MLDHDPAAISSSLQELARKPWEYGQILLYQYQMRQSGTQHVVDALGSQVFRQTPEGWRPCGGGGFAINPEFPAGHVVQAASGWGQCGELRYATLYGRAMTSEAAVVEAEFDNGQVLRSECTRRTFALAAAEATHVVRFRVYDSSNRILQEESWPPSVF
jgi:hypothetical protein